MKYLLVIILMMGGCGRLGTVEHEGTVDTVISINETQLKKYFTITCTEDLTAQLVAAGAPDPTPTPTAINTCVDEHIARFLDTLSSLKG